jgi:hypothetical protein
VDTQPKWTPNATSASPRAIGHRSRALCMAGALATCAALVALPTPALGQWWFSRLPTTYYVEQTNQGSDARDSAARQAAAYAVLRDYIESNAGANEPSPDKVRPDTQRRFQEYAAAQNRLIARANLTDADIFRQALITAHFSGPDRVNYLKRQLRDRVPGGGKDTAKVDRVLVEQQLRTLFAMVPADTKQTIKIIVLAVGAPMLLAFVLGLIALARELTGAYGLRGGGSPRLAIGWKELPLRTFTGAVARSDRGAAFLRSAEGREHAVAAPLAASVAARDGHVLSAIWSLNKDGAPNRDLVVRNHTTDQVFYDSAVLRSLLEPRAAIHGAAWPAALAFLVWNALGPFVYMLATRSPSFEPLWTPAVKASLAAVVLTPVVVSIWRAYTASSRVARCKSDLKGRVLSSLDLDADDLRPAANRA